QESGSITMFRPDANAARFNSTARRMAMPELPAETFIRALELLVAQDREWVPGGAGNSLYLRPFMIATQRGLGVNHPSSEYLFCVRGGNTAEPWIVTPPLTGTLLPGITRDALLKLAPQLGIKAVEEPITIDQWQAECAAGELTEVFACGTAAVITPVGQVKSETAAWAVADGEPGPVTMRLREELRSEE